jgi:hypothetical protein
MNGWTKMSFNVGESSVMSIWVNPNEITGTTKGIINQDCNGLPIISSINGTIGWTMAATGFYCLTLPVASSLTGNGPCIPPPTPPTNNFWTWLQKTLFNALLWNKWVK